MRKYTELEKIRARNYRRAWWKRNKQDILDFCALLVFVAFYYWAFCLLCFVFPEW